MNNKELREECEDKEFYAYGTAYLFERRTNSLRWRLRIITFLSLAVPVCVGGIVMATGKLVEIAVFSGGVLSVFLFVLTIVLPKI